MRGERRASRRREFSASTSRGGRTFVVDDGATELWARASLSHARGRASVIGRSVGRSIDRLVALVASSFRSIAFGCAHRKSKGLGRPARPNARCQRRPMLRDFRKSPQVKPRSRRSRGRERFRITHLLERIALSPKTLRFGSFFCLFFSPSLPSPHPFPGPIQEEGRGVLNCCCGCLLLLWLLLFFSVLIRTRIAWDPSISCSSIRLCITQRPLFPYPNPPSPPSPAPPPMHLKASIKNRQKRLPRPALEGQQRAPFSPF